MYLYRRKATYYFRMRIPHILANDIHLQEIRHSLNTTKKSKAKRLALFLAYKVDLLLNNFVKAIKMSKAPIDIQHMRSLIKNYVNEAIIEYSDLEDMRHEALTYYDGFGNRHMGHTSEAIDNANSELSAIVGRYNDEEMKRKGEEILSRTNINHEDVKQLSTKEQNIFWAELLKKESEILHYDKKRNESRLNGGELKEEQETQKNKSPELQAIIQAFNLNTESLNSSQSKKKKSENMFIEKSKVFFANESKSRRWGSKTNAKVLHALKTAVSIMGDKDLSEYTRRDFEYCRSILQYLPPNYEKMPIFKNKSIIEISNINKRNEEKGKEIRTLADTTVNTTLGWIFTYFDWAVLSGYADKNYAMKLKVKRTTNAIEDKLPFDDTDLSEMSDTMLKEAYANRRQKPAYFWFILIGFYSGLRLEEIAQLHIEDVYEKFGHWVFDINDRPDKHGKQVKSVKNNPSKRVIPIHPKLIEYGFIEYFQKVKKAGHDRVWFMLKRDKNGYGRNPSRTFNRHVKKNITNSDKKTFHSMRHTFIQACKNISMDDHKRRSLTGRGEKDIDYIVYGSKFNADILYEELSKIEYPIIEEFFNKNQSL